MKNTISIFIQKNPIFIGIVSVAIVFLFGISVISVTLPTVAHAQLAPPCCTLPPPLPPVIPPPPPYIPPVIPLPIPTCTLSASKAPAPYSIGYSILTWKTSAVTSASINHNIGTVSASGGSKRIHISKSGTYILSVKGSGGKTTCSAKITAVTSTPTPPPTPTPAPTCTLSSSPASIVKGSSSTLHYTTTNAASFKVNNGVGTLTPTASGSKYVSPNVTTTYTGTATGSGGTVTCGAKVTVTSGGGGGGGGGGPMCVLIVTPSTMASGLSATLSWGGSGIKNIFINNGIGTTTKTNGSVSISPSVGVHTYSGIFTTPYGQKLKCSSKITVTGGAPIPPLVTLSYFRKSPPSHPLSLVFLSQIPSTGLELGPVGTVIYWLILVLWSIAIAYLLLFIIVPFLKRKLQVFGARVDTILNAQPVQQDTSISNNKKLTPLSMPIPMSSKLVKEQSTHSAYNGFSSFAQSGALSVEDIVHGLSRTEQEYAVQDGIVNESSSQSVSPVQPLTHDISETLSSILSTQNMIRSKNTQDKILTESTTPAPTPSDEEQLIQTSKNDISDTVSVRGFVAALLEGDRTAVFYALRQVARGGGDITRLLADATCMLDDAYRARVDGTDCNQDIIRLTAKYQTPVLEEIISALATAIDSSYSSNVTAAKLALTRALSKIGA